MSLIFAESRRKPLRAVYSDNKEAHFPSYNGKDAIMKSSWALWQFGPSRLRRHHSIGSYVPYFFTELKSADFKGNSDADGSFNSTSAGQARDNSNQVTVWPDTDDETEELMSMSPTYNGYGPCSAQAPSFESKMQDDEVAPFEYSGGDESSNQGGGLTWMIRHLPYAITQQDLMSKLDAHGYADKYNFLYYPQSFEARRGKGYAFVNFINAEVAAEFVNVWQGGWMFQSPSEEGGSAKIQEQPLVIKLALVQGLEANARKWIRMSRVRDPLLRPFIRSQIRGRGVVPSPKGFDDQGLKANEVPDGVTTLMIRNLPFNMMQQTLLNELDAAGFAYDFVHMPRSFNTLEGKGYAFVNFVNREVAASFMASWQGKRCFALSANGQPLNISVASVQGLHANVQKWSDVRLNRIRNPALRPFVRGAQSGEDMPSTPSSSSSPENHCWSPVMRTLPGLPLNALSSPVCSANATADCQPPSPTRATPGFVACWSPVARHVSGTSPAALPGVVDCERIRQRMSTQVSGTATLTAMSLSQMLFEQSSTVALSMPHEMPNTAASDVYMPVVQMMEVPETGCHGRSERQMEQQTYSHIVEPASLSPIGQDFAQFGHAMHWPR